VTAPPLRPERLAELLDGAVRHVTAQADALDRIRFGVRRRRAVRRIGAIVLAAVVLAGGGVTALAVASSPGPSRLGPSAAAPGQRATVGPTPTSTTAYGYDEAAPAIALGPGSVAVRMVTPSGRSGSWDIDGGGRPAAVTIEPVGNPQTTSSFLLAVRLALSTQTVPFTATSVKDMPPGGPVIIGTADAAHDGHPELFVQVDAGCCTEFWTIFRLVDGNVRQMSISGQPVRLAVGGSVMNNGGFSCDGPDLAVYAYSEGDTAGTFLTIRDTYRWVGAALVLRSHQQTTVHASPGGPELAKYSGVACGGLSTSRGEL
jgi:hypothetical protein